MSVQTWGKLKKNVWMFIWPRKSFIFAVRERFHLRKQNLIKLGGAYVTSTGEPSSKRTSARYGGPTRQTQHGKAVRSCRLLQHTATV